MAYRSVCSRTRFRFFRSCLRGLSLFIFSHSAVSSSTLGFGTFSSFHTNPSYSDPEPCISHLQPGYKLVKACAKSIIVCRDKITGRFPWRSSATHRFHNYFPLYYLVFCSKKKYDCWVRSSARILYTSLNSSYWVSLST